MMEVIFDEPLQLITHRSSRHGAWACVLVALMGQVPRHGDGVQVWLVLVQAQRVWAFWVGYAGYLVDHV